MTRSPEYWRAFGPRWFSRWQVVLLLILAEPLLGRVARHVLAIRTGDAGHRGEIVRIGPDSYTVANPDGTFTFEGRTHWKYSKRVYRSLRPLWWLLHGWDQLVANPFVPAWNAGFDTLTAYPDANVETTTVDGNALRFVGSESFATIRAGAGTSFNDSGAESAYAQLGASTTLNEYFIMLRSFFLFDTSSIGSSASISAATFSLWGTNKGNALGSDVFHLAAGSPASNTALAASDYGNISRVTFGNIAYASFDATNTVYSPLTLNAAGLAAISKTGVSKFSAQLSWDLNGAFGGAWASSGQTYFQGLYADQAGTTSDPKLVVTYGITATGTESDRVGLTESTPRVVVSARPSETLPAHLTDSPAVRVSVRASDSLRVAMADNAIAAAFGAVTKTATDSLRVKAGSESATGNANLTKRGGDTLRIGFSDHGFMRGGVWRPLAVRVDAEYADDGVWEDVTSAVWQGAPIQIHYGCEGVDPMDNTAGSGTAQFELLNTTDGVYSPSSVAAVSGWGIGLRMRVVAVLPDDSEEVQFVGTVAIIDPDAGLFGPRRVRVLLYDYMKVLAEAKLREVSVKISQTDRSLVLDAMAAVISDVPQPPLALDAALDTYNVAFDELGEGASAMSLIKAVMDSTFGKYFQRRDGIHQFRNREILTFQASKDTFTSADFAPGALSVPSDLDTLVSRVVVERPNVVLGTGVEVLASEQGQDSEGIGTGLTVERWTDYRDPNDTSTDPVAVSGYNFAAGFPVSGTDFVFNSSSDGLGANVTASMVVTAYPFANTAKWLITNGSGAAAYRITLQVRGHAVRRYKPTTVQSESMQRYGVREMRIRNPYQNSLTVAQFQADYIQGQYATWLQRPTKVAIVPDRSDRLMAHALTREVTDRITLQETVTGLAADAIIQNITKTFQQTARGVFVTCEWGLAPQSSFMFITPWEMETVTRGELGNATVLG